MSLAGTLSTVGCEFQHPLAESSTLETLLGQNRIFRSVVVRDERSSTAVGKPTTGTPTAQSLWTADVNLATYAMWARRHSLAVSGMVGESGSVLHSTQIANIYTQDFISKFLEHDALLFSLYAPNVAARIVSLDTPQPLWASPDLADTSWQLNFGLPLSNPGLTATQTLENAYVIDNAAQVVPFVEENRLTDILIQAIEPIRKTFGGAFKRTLTLVEDDEGSCTLFCLVAFPGSLQEARTALDSFDRDWWLGNAREFASKLNFDFELV